MLPLQSQPREMTEKVRFAILYFPALPPWLPVAGGHTHQKPLLLPPVTHPPVHLGGKNLLETSFFPAGQIQSMRSIAGSPLLVFTKFEDVQCPSLCVSLYVSLVQEMTLGSSELLYVAGSYLPITIEEEEEEEYGEEPPKPPPRVPKISSCHSAEPKISFSYTHDPRLTPTRKVSGQSQTSLSVEPNKLAASTRSLNSLAPPSPSYSSSTPQTLPRRKRARKDKKEEEDLSYPEVTPRQKKRIEVSPTPPPRAKSAEIKLPVNFPNDSPSELQKDKSVEIAKEIPNAEETSPRLLAPPRRYATIPRRGKGRVSQPLTCPQLTVCGDPVASFSCRELTQLVW